MSKKKEEETGEIGHLYMVCSDDRAGKKMVVIEKKDESGGHKFLEMRIRGYESTPDTPHRESHKQYRFDNVKLIENNSVKHKEHKENSLKLFFRTISKFKPWKKKTYDEDDSFLLRVDLNKKTIRALKMLMDMTITDQELEEVSDMPGNKIVNWIIIKGSAESLGKGE